MMLAQSKPRQPGILTRISRLIRYRLVLPMLRGRYPATDMARGTMIGIFCGLMPIIGQTSVVLLIWLILARLFRWQFSIVIAAIWTWISNPITSPAIFYGFYVTGQILLGRWHDLSGFSSFSAIIADLFAGDLTLGERLRQVFDILFLDWGLALWVGFFPWAILAGWLGYRWSLRLVEAYRRLRVERLAQRREAKTGLPA